MNKEILFETKNNDQYVFENGAKYLVLNGRKYKVLQEDDKFTGKPAEEARERRKENKRLKKLEIQDVMESQGMSYREAKDYVEWRAGVGEEYFIDEVCRGEYDDDKNMIPSDFYRED